MTPITTAQLLDDPTLEDANVAAMTSAQKADTLRRLLPHLQELVRERLAPVNDLLAKLAAEAEVFDRANPLYSLACHAASALLDPLGKGHMDDRAQTAGTRRPYVDFLHAWPQTGMSVGTILLFDIDGELRVLAGVRGHGLPQAGLMNFIGGGFVEAHDMDKPRAHTAVLELNQETNGVFNIAPHHLEPVGELCAVTDYGKRFPNRAVNTGIFAAIIEGLSTSDVLDALEPNDEFSAFCLLRADEVGKPVRGIGWAFANEYRVFDMAMAVAAEGRLPRWLAVPDGKGGFALQGDEPVAAAAELPF